MDSRARSSNWRSAPITVFFLTRGVSAQLVSTSPRLERGSIERNRGLVADGPGGGKERSVAGESKKDLAVAVVRLPHGELDAIDDEKRELGVLRAVLAKSFALARWRDVIFSLCFPLASLRFASAKRVGVS